MGINGVPDFIVETVLLHPMPTTNNPGSSGNNGRYVWITGIVAGLVSAIITGIIIQFGFDPAILSSGIPAGFGVSGLSVGWAIFIGIGIILGLIYAGVTRIGRLAGLVGRPRTGVYIGIGYGLVLWVLAVILVPILVGSGAGGVGEYAVNLRGVLSFALLGIIIGLVYAVSPYTD